MKISYRSTQQIQADISDEDAKEFTARYLRKFFGFCGPDYNDSGTFVNTEGELYEGWWEGGHNNDWETKVLRKATQAEKHGAAVILLLEK